MLTKTIYRRSAPLMSRHFASATADYQTLDQAKFYQPERKVESMTIFNSEDCKERKFVPWEVKDAIFKNAKGIVGVVMADTLFSLGNFYGIA